MRNRKWKIDDDLRNSEYLTDHQVHRLRNYPCMTTKRTAFLSSLFVATGCGLDYVSAYLPGFMT